jgi:hypothetical protein
MKTITIIGADKVESTSTLHRVGKDLVVYGGEEMSIFDGYHTFDELYDHRVTLYIAFCNVLANRNYVAEELNVDKVYVWRSKKHSDGGGYEGWFILGIGIEKDEQITYHIPNERWTETSFADTLMIAPTFDGHTSQDVLARIKSLL